MSDSVDDIAVRLHDYANNGSRSWIGIEAVFTEAAGAITDLRAEVAQLRGMLLSLATAEAEYRLLHDLHGDGDMRTGRGWDWMRRKGDEARAALTQTKDTTDG